jgi:hypothetical protein
MRFKKRETKHKKAKKSVDEILIKEALLFFVIASFLRKLLKLSEWRCEKLADGCW